MESKQSNTGLIVTIVVLVMIIIFGICLFILSNAGYLKFNNNTNKEQTTNTSIQEENITEDEALTLGKTLYDKATEIYEVWVLRPYCGYGSNEIDSQESKEFDVATVGTVPYYYSGFSNLEELKEYLKNYLQESIVDDKISEQAITDLSLLKNESYAYANYIETDGKLYCRAYTGKGWLSYYLNDYSITVDNIEQDKITYSIKSSYANDTAIENNSKCIGSANINDCNDNEIEYKNTTFTIEKNNSNNWVVSYYELHD